MSTKSSLKSARFNANKMREDLAQRYSLRWHGFFLGSLTLGITWLTSACLLMAGVESMAVRYGVAFLVGYLAYIGLIRLWGWHVCNHRRFHDGDGAGTELAVDAMDFWWMSNRHSGGTTQAMASGRGGDFGGGGATGDWIGDTNVPSSGAMEEVVGGAFKGAGEVIAGSDDGAVVVIPIVAIFIMALLFFVGLGSIAFLYFGSEVLLAVAVQLAFSYTASNAAVKIAKGGWLGSVWRITWKPMLGSLLCAVALGFMFDTFVPQANTMVDVVRILTH